jgi:hypothetical protein
MWMSECIIVVDRNNVDSNGIADIASAVRELGAVVQVDELRFVIEATVPAHEIPTVSAMTGVTYVRSVFSYFCGQPPLKTA